MPLSYRFNSDEMQYVIDNSDATLVIADAEYAPLIEAAAATGCPRCGPTSASSPPRHRPKCRDGWLSWPDVIAGRPDDEPVALDASTVGAQMIYTSGTTGKPKGALRTTTNREIVLALLAELGLQFGNEVHITTGPMYHSGPLAFVSINHTLGAPIVVLRRFDPVAWLAAVKLHGATNSFSAPTQLKRVVSLPPEELAHADLSSMRCLIANAAPVPYALKQEIIEKLGDGFLFEVYGSTELGIITVLQARGPAAQAGVVRQAVRRHRVPDREGGRHRGRATRERRAVHVHRARDGRLPPHRRAAQRVRRGPLEVGRRHRVRGRGGLPLHL